MCTILQNESVKDGSVFHTLPLSIAQKLHSADHIPNTARLACVMADQNGNVQWETFGLSGFMCPSKNSQPSDLTISQDISIFNSIKSYAKRKAEALDPGKYQSNIKSNLLIFTYK